MNPSRQNRFPKAFRQSVPVPPHSSADHSRRERHREYALIDIRILLIRLASALELAQNSFNNIKAPPMHEQTRQPTSAVWSTFGVSERADWRRKNWRI
jgi:hypothetical protein